MSVLLLLLLLLLCLICHVSCVTNTTTSPTSQPASTSTSNSNSNSTFVSNPFVSFPAADIQNATLNASRPSYVAPINGVAPSSMMYIQVDVVTAASSPSPVKVQLNLANRDGTTQSWLGTLMSTTSSYVVIRPGLTGQACSAAASPRVGGTCNFTLQVTATIITTPQEIQVTYIRATPRSTGSQLTASTTFPNVVVYGVELSPSALSAGVPLSLQVVPGSPSPSLSPSPRALDLWVAHETQIDSPLYPQTPNQQTPKTLLTESFVLNSTSAPFASLSKTAPLATSLFLLAVVPTVNNTNASGIASTTTYVLTIGGTPPTKPTDGTGQTGGGTTLMMAVPASYIISFVILAGIAILGFCCFALYLIAKRRRDRLSGIGEGNSVDIGAGTVTSGRVMEAQPPPPGVTLQELELIPIHTQPPKSATDEALCSVCLSGYDSSQSQPLRTLACGHCYHVSCIDPWLQQHRTCPYCRVDAIPSTTGHDKKNIGHDTPRSTAMSTPRSTTMSTPRSTGTTTTTAGAPSLPPSRVRLASIHSAVASPTLPSVLAGSPSSHSHSPYYVEEDAVSANRNTDMHMPDNRV